MLAMQGENRIRSASLLMSVASFFIWISVLNFGQVVLGFSESSFTPRLNRFITGHGKLQSAPKPSFRRQMPVVKAGREDEIRRKIAQLKRQGKITNQPSVTQDDGTIKAPSVSDQYGDKVRQKLGAKKAKLMGTYGQTSVDEEDAVFLEVDGDDDEEEALVATSTRRQAQLGALAKEEDDDDAPQSSYEPPSSTTEYKNFDASLFAFDEDDDEEDDEDALVDLVAAKLQEKREREQKEKEEAGRKKLEELKQEQKELREEEKQLTTNADSSSSEKLTSGIGGRWTKSNETSGGDYKPSKSGTWGVFERPKDISRAFGGGKRVGAGYTPDVLNKQQSEEDTRARLRQYREKVGIEVQSEKDHAAEIEQALEIGKRAMEVRHHVGTDKFICHILERIVAHT